MKLFENHLSTATNMLDILKGIEAEMDASLSPNNRAMQSLGVDSFGCCSEIYTKEAEELWTKQLTWHSNDPDTIHHLSILHHARAFDVEFSNDPTKADIDWEKSSKYWQQLICNDAFWNRISSELGGDYASRVEKIRDQLPERLLSIHFSIAYSPSTVPHRAKFHIKHALQAGFPADTLKMVRVSTYERFTSDLPDEVWCGNLAEQSLLKGACDKIRRILEVDPECIAALHDVIRIQKHLLTMQLHLIAEHQDDDAQVLKIQKELRDQANEWVPYFELLILYQSSMPDDVRENLLYWLQWMGDIKTRLKDYHGAIEYFDKGTLICSHDDSARKQELLKSAAIYHALYARDLADQNSSAAKTECKKASARSGHSALSQYLLAKAYQILEDYETALIACDRGISLVDEDASDSASSRADIEMVRERLLGLKKQLELAKVLHAAQKTIDNKDYEKAIDLYSKALDAGHGNFIVYYMRCQCYVAIKNAAAAKKDLTKMDALAKSNEECEAVLRLDQQIQDTDIGDKYLEPAQKAIESKNYKKAIDLYSKAIDAGYGYFDVYFMRCRCYISIKKVDAAKEDLTKMEALAKSDEEHEALRRLNQQIQDMDIGNKYLEPANKAIDNKDFKRAIDLYSNALDAGHGNFIVYYMRCQCYIAIKNTAAAKKDLTKMGALAKSDEEREAVGRILQQIQDMDIGNKYLEPANKAIDNKDFKRAIDLYSNALDAGHGNFIVYYMRCQCYAVTNDDNAALADLQKCELFARNSEEKKRVQDLKNSLPKSWLMRYMIGYPVPFRLRSD